MALSVRLPTTLRAPWVARRHVRRALRAAGVKPQVAKTAAQLANELVTNAILYSPGDHVTVTVDVADEIEVTVWDADPRLVGPPDSGTGGLHGRGLRLVDRLAGAWGSRPQGRGKIVWFRLSQTPTGS